MTNFKKWFPVLVTIVFVLVPIIVTSCGSSSSSSSATTTTAAATTTTTSTTSTTISSSVVRIRGLAATSGSSRGGIKTYDLVPSGEVTVSIISSGVTLELGTGTISNGVFSVDISVTSADSYAAADGYLENVIVSGSGIGSITKAVSTAAGSTSYVTRADESGDAERQIAEEVIIAGVDINVADMQSALPDLSDATASDISSLADIWQNLEDGEDDLAQGLGISGDAYTTYSSAANDNSTFISNLASVYQDEVESQTAATAAAVSNALSNMEEEIFDNATSAATAQQQGDLQGILDAYVQGQAAGASLSTNVSTLISNQQNINICKTYLVAVNSAAQLIGSVATSGGQSIDEINTDQFTEMDAMVDTLISSLAALAVADASASTVQDIARLNFFEVYVAPGVPGLRSGVTAMGTPEWTDLWNNYQNQHFSQITAEGVIGIQAWFAMQFTLDEWVNTVSPALENLSSAKSTLNTSTSLSTLQTASISEIASSLSTYNSSLNQSAQAVVTLFASKFNIGNTDALNLAKAFNFTTTAPVEFYRE